MKMIRSLLIATLIIFIFSCTNSKKTDTLKDSTQSKEVPNQIQHIEKNEGESYSDSFINTIVTSQYKAVIPIDTFKILHNIRCDQNLDLINDTFSVKSAEKYKAYQISIAPQLEQIIGVNRCISHYKSSENYDAYIFYSNQLDSHSSSPFLMISINKNNNTFHQLPLAREYGNELGNYLITSTLRPDKTIERRVNHNLNYVHDVGVVDSTYLIREVYKINAQGIFELLSSRLENSVARYSVFEN